MSDVSRCRASKIFFLWFLETAPDAKMRARATLSHMQLSDIDKVLVRYGDTLSPAQIAVKLKGVLTPEQVLARLHKLTETPDWLSAAQEDQLITLKMKVIVQELSELPLTARNAEVILKGLSEIGNRLDRRLSATEADLNKHYAFEGMVLLDMTQSAITFMRDVILSGKQLSEASWDEHMMGALRQAELTMGAHESDAEVVTIEAVSKPQVR